MCMQTHFRNNPLISDITVCLSLKLLLLQIWPDQSSVPLQLAHLCCTQTNISLVTKSTQNN